MLVSYKNVQSLLKFDFLETMISEIRGFDLQGQRYGYTVRGPGAGTTVVVIRGFLKTDWTGQEITGEREHYKNNTLY